jgi:hypothetical protein
MTVRRPGGIAPALAARRVRPRHPRVISNSAR